MATTRILQHAKAAPSAVYRLLLDPDAVRRWQVPDGMTSEVHEFEAREGGRFRISLTYRGDEAGKSGGHTDTFHGRFLQLDPDRCVVQSTVFETDNPALQGALRITYSLTAAAGGTDIEGVHENLPPGVAPADNEAGWRMSLGKLARMAEAL